MFRFLIFALGFTALLFSSCSGHDDGATLIWENSSWRVTTATFSDNEVSLNFVTDSTAGFFPVSYTSSPLLDNVYSKGVTDFFSDASPLVYDRHTLEGIVSLSLLDPDAAVEIVTEASRRAMSTRPDWPLCAAELTWIEAAASLSKITGDQALIDSILPKAIFVMEREIDIAYNPEQHLFRALLPVLPDNLSRQDALSVYSLRVNIDRITALRALGNMLGREGKKYTEMAKEITSAVNDRFWIPEKGRYGCALWGKFYPVLLTISDNVGQLMAVNYGIATDEMAHSIISSMPLSEDGVPDIFPVAPRHKPNYSLDAQLLLFDAAVKIDTETEALMALGSAAASIYGNADIADHQSPAFAATILHSMAGLKLVSDHLIVDPFIPSIFPGEKVFTSLVYKESTFDLHITGTGSHVARINIDGVAQNRLVIPDSLTGHHRIDIVMANNMLSTPRLSYASSTSIPPTVEIDSLSQETFKIHKLSGNYSYTTSVNGIRCANSSDGVFTVSRSRNGAKFITAMAVDNEGFTSVPAPPIMVLTPSDTIILSRNSIPHQLREAVVNRIAKYNTRRNKRQREIPTHLELTPDINTTLDFVVTAPASGTYFVDMAYWRPALNECFITDICQADSTVGTFVMAAQKGFSNQVTINLRKGRNHLSLNYHPLPSGNLQAGVCLEYLRFLPKKITP